MANFEITLTNDSVQYIDDAEAYQQEGPMTTFFVTDTSSGHLDAWATRLASFRSNDVAIIRRVTADVTPISAGRSRLDLIELVDAG